MITWQYLAGFFDGEGSIGYSTRNLKVDLPQSGSEGLLLLKEIQDFLLSNNIISQINTRKTLGPLQKKTDNRLTLQNRNEIRKFLKGILPFVRIKKTKVQDHSRFLTLYPIGGTRC